MITLETVFAVQVGSLIAFVVALFVLYRVLVHQKDATIELLRENVAFLNDRLALAESQSPDVLAQALSDRVKTLEDELRRLGNDYTATKAQVAAKEAELADVERQASELTARLVKSRLALSGAVEHAQQVLARVAAVRSPQEKGPTPGP